MGVVWADMHCAARSAMRAGLCALLHGRMLPSHTYEE